MDRLVGIADEYGTIWEGEPGASERLGDLVQRGDSETFEVRLSGREGERLTFADAVHEIRAKLVELQNAPHEEHPGPACPICLLTNRMLSRLVEEQRDA